MPPQVDAGKAQAQKVLQLKRSMGGSKTHLTLTAKTARNLCSYAVDSDNHTEIMANELTDQQIKLRRACDKLSETLRRLIEEDPDGSEVYQTGLEDAAETYMEYNIMLFDALSRVETRPKPDAQPPIVANQAMNIKIAGNLLPGFKLARDSNPTLLTSWLDSFRDFYTASGLQTVDIGTQQAYFKKYMNPDLFAQLGRIRPGETPIYAADDLDCCVKFLKEEFLASYPLVVRRYEFFNFTQTKATPFTDFYAEMQKLGDLAALADIRVDEIFIYRILCGASDAKMKAKILELPHPWTLVEVLRVCRSYEVAQSTMGRVDPSRVVSHAAKAFQPEKKKSGKGDKDGKKKSKDSKNASGSAKGACDKCGRDHAKGQCPAAKSKCRKCEKVGHWDKVCRSGGKGQSSEARASSPTPPSKANYCFCTYQRGSRPTPRLEMTFEASSGTAFNPFTRRIVPDTGATRSIVALSVAQRHGIKFVDAPDERLFDAQKNEMIVNGKVDLAVTYEGTTIEADALVSSSLQGNEILVSWHDLERLDAVHIGHPRFRADAMQAAMQVEEEPPNMDGLKAKMDDQVKVFSDVMSDTLNAEPMAGPPMRIELKGNPIPRKVFVVRQPALALAKMAEELTIALCDLGVIYRVPTTEISDWISRGCFVKKPNGGCRMVVDLSALNLYVKRPTHPFPPAREIIKNIASTSRYFAKLDATMGYYQIALEEESSKLTTFLTPWGRFRYLRAPMGLSSSSDAWCYRSDEAVAGLPGVLKLVDDILVQADTVDQLIERVSNVLQRCREHKITISKKKLEYGQSVTFAGFRVGSTGIQPNPDMTRAIRDFPTPTDVPGVRSFLGMLNQLGWFIPDLAHITEPIRHLLKKGIAFQWLESHQWAFDKAKEVLTSDMLVSHFDPNLKTELVTDASRVGLGFALIQRAPGESRIRLIQAGSRSLNDAETRYAVSELECLAIHYAVDKCSHYLIGSQFEVVTDHKPLLGTFSKPLDDIGNVRLRRYREKLAGYSFTVRWVEGKTHYIADALSRHPVFPPPEEEAAGEDNIANVVLGQALSTDPKLQALVGAAASDDDYQSVKKALLEGLATKDLPPGHPARAYSNVWRDLSVYENGLLILEETRIVVPASQRRNILDLLHVPHGGQEKTKKAARQLYYWPRLNNDIKVMVENCEDCRYFLPSQAQEPLIMTTSDGPMTTVGVDLYSSKQKNYIVMVDHYSGWIWTEKLSELQTSAITNQLTDWFQEWGWPAYIRTDGGPQFRKEFGVFCKEHGISRGDDDQGPSSPYHSQSNGLAEAGVKQAKHLLEKYRNELPAFRRALAEYRNLPRADGHSAAQLFLHRRQRGLLPTLPSATATDFAAQEGAAMRQQSRSDKTSGLKRNPLTPLIVGQYVCLQDTKSLRWEEKGRIVSIRDDGRSYDLVMSDGSKYLRNRKFLRPIRAKDEDSSPSKEKVLTPQEPRRSARLSDKRSVRLQA
jgi:hypothetical protein